MASARKSFIQTAQDNIRNDLFEGCEAQFFRGMQVIASDPADILAQATQALAETGLCIVVEVQGGPAPIPGDYTDWDARVTVAEHPSISRPGDGKTADVVVDAVLRRFADGGHFRPKRVVPDHRVEPDGTAVTAIYVIEGTTTILLATTPNPGGTC